jgi:hypothetical protein
MIASLLNSGFIKCISISAHITKQVHVNRLTLANEDMIVMQNYINSEWMLDVLLSLCSYREQSDYCTCCLALVNKMHLHFRSLTVHGMLAGCVKVVLKQVIGLTIDHTSLSLSKIDLYGE